MNVLVVDDERLARSRLRRMLERIPGVTVVAEAADGIEALQAIAQYTPDAVFLDIRMPGLDGLTLATREDDLPPIVFTTAYDEYAVSAFEAAAIDYLMKPVEQERLVASVERIREHRTRVDPKALLEAMQHLGASGDRLVPRLTARCGDTTRIFDPRDISRFHASDKYVAFVQDGEEFLLDDSLNTLETRLEEHGFFRCHRGELINLNRVVALHHEDDTLSVELSDGQTAAVSRRSAPDLKRRLGA